MNYRRALRGVLIGRRVNRCGRVSVRLYLFIYLFIYYASSRQHNAVQHTLTCTMNTNRRNVQLDDMQLVCNSQQRWSFWPINRQCYYANN